jgi:hypothetical protein
VTVASLPLDVSMEKSPSGFGGGGGTE